MPAARVGFRMFSLEQSKVAVIGGMGSEAYNDMKVFEVGGIYKWKNEKYENELLGDIPEPRYGHSLNSYGNHVVLLGGGGP